MPSFPVASESERQESRADQTVKAIPSPWLYIITLYLPFGLMNGMLTSFPATLFKVLGYSNTVIGLLKGIGLVTAFRFLYAPWLDGVSSKRRLSLVTLVLAAGLLGSIAVLVFARTDMELFAWGMAAALFALAFISASHETASDGFYIRALDVKSQAQFIGIKTAAIRIGGMTAIMGLLYGATKLAAHLNAVSAESPDKSGFHVGFAAAYAAAAFLMLVFALWNKAKLPVILQDTAVSHKGFAVMEVLREYFAQPKVLYIVLVILLYRFGEGFLFMRVPFLLDGVDVGGLGSSASAIPIYTLLTDIPWAIAGGIMGGYIMKWLGLRRTFLPLALCMNLPNLFYVWLAINQPTQHVHWFGENLNIALLICSSVDSLGYGIGFSALFYYMHVMATESGRNKTSILAISFAIMNVGFFFPGMMSGLAQKAFGYVGVFVISSTVGLLALIVIPLLPMPKAEAKS